MRRPTTIKHEMEKLASHGGLIHIGALLEAIKFRSRFNTINGVHCVNPKISHGDILATMIALISIGKPDYDAIEIFRKKQDFFNKAVGIRACLSSPTLRQRIDLIGNQANTLIKDAGVDLDGRRRGHGANCAVDRRSPDDDNRTLCPRTLLCPLRIQRPSSPVVLRL